MILLVLVFASNFVFTWVIPIACVSACACVCACACACACVGGENQALLVKFVSVLFEVKTHSSNCFVQLINKSLFMMR